LDPDTLEALRANALFNGIPGEHLDGVLRSLDAVRCEDGHVIFEENEPGDFTYLIASGEVRISKSLASDRKDRQEILAYLEKGDFFGEMALYDPAPRSARAVAVGSCVLGRLSRDQLEQLSRVSPLEVAGNLTRGVIRRLRDANQRHMQELLDAERLTALGSMASTIIHDLTNPISQIRGAATMLERGVSPERLPWIVGIIRGAVTRMLELTQDLLQYSRGSAISLRPEPISAEELMAGLRAEILDDLRSRGYDVREGVDADGPLELDWSRFRRVLVNMLTNAADAMPDGGPITVSLRLLERSVEFTVSDEGCGIPEEIVGKIFDPFFTRGKPGGTGLGMWISRAIVEAHGGKIEVETANGKGCRFTVGLPQPIPRTGGAL
jgi:signal transduction histidine kinase